MGAITQGVDLAVLALAEIILIILFRGEDHGLKIRVLMGTVAKWLGLDNPQLHQYTVSPAFNSTTAGWVAAILGSFINS